MTKDRVKTSVNGFSALGLVEMTRKRTAKALGTYCVTNAQPAASRNGENRGNGML
ncbi:ribonuclease E/G [Escherichia coli]